MDIKMSAATIQLKLDHYLSLKETDSQSIQCIFEQYSQLYASSNTPPSNEESFSLIKSLSSLDVDNDEELLDSILVTLERVLNKRLQNPPSDLISELLTWLQLQLQQHLTMDIDIDLISSVILNLLFEQLWNPLDLQQENQFWQRFFAHYYKIYKDSRKIHIILVYLGCCQSLHSPCKQEFKFCGEKVISSAHFQSHLWEKHPHHFVYAKSADEGRLFPPELLCLTSEKLLSELFADGHSVDKNRSKSSSWFDFFQDNGIQTCLLQKLNSCSSSSGMKIGLDFYVVKYCPLSQKHTYTSDVFREENESISHFLKQQNRKGFTVGIRAVHTRSHLIGSFCRFLQQKFGQYVNANLYWTPPGQQGFQPHYDDHCVFILQIEGYKTWYIGRQVKPLPVLYSASPVERKDSGENKIELSPGDVLYIPRGFIHHASTECHLQTDSVHLTIGIDVEEDYTRKSLIETIIHRLSNSGQPVKKKLKSIDKATIDIKAKLNECSLMHSQMYFGGLMAWDLVDVSTFMKVSIELFEFFHHFVNNSTENDSIVNNEISLLMNELLKCDLAWWDSLYSEIINKKDLFLEERNRQSMFYQYLNSPIQTW